MTRDDFQVSMARTHPRVMWINSPNNGNFVQGIFNTTFISLPLSYIYHIGIIRHLDLRTLCFFNLFFFRLSIFVGLVDGFDTRSRAGLFYNPVYINDSGSHMRIGKESQATRLVTRTSTANNTLPLETQSLDIDAR